MDPTRIPAVHHQSSLGDLERLPQGKCYGTSGWAVLLRQNDKEEASMFTAGAIIQSVRGLQVVGVEMKLPAGPSHPHWSSRL